MPKFSLKQWRPSKTISVFLGCLGIALALIFHFSSAIYVDMNIVPTQLSDLEKVFKKHGIDAFLSAKKTLGNSISKTLKNPPNEQAEIAATNVALYMFPDLLPDANFEKSVATEMWAPLQSAIEKAPQTEESRTSFEEMRANVWNFENPDRNNPVLSSYAHQMLRLYHGLSER